MLDMPLWDALSGSALPIIPAFNNQDLTNTAWALAPCRFLNEPLLNSISAASIFRQDEWQPQDRANTAWALAKLGFCHEPLLSAISAVLQRRLSNGDPQNWANIAWAWTAMKPKEEASLDRAAEQRITNIRSLGMQEVANSVW